jgi:hypothetical protein
VSESRSNDLKPSERDLVGCYETLVTVLGQRREELAPFEERNAIKAAAALWQVVNGLNLEPGQVYEIGA